MSYYLYSPISDSLREFVFMTNNGIEGLFDMSGSVCIKTNNCFRSGIPHDNLISAISDYLIDNKDKMVKMDLGTGKLKISESFFHHTADRLSVILKIGYELLCSAKHRSKLSLRKSIQLAIEP